MNSKSMRQILAPFAVTVLLFIASYFIVIITSVTTDILDIDSGVPDFFEINIFDFDQTSTILFWIVDIIIIIIVEIQLSDE